jgi:hypothetical protein
MSKKIPVSVLILLHDNAGNVLLFNRLNPDGFWQSVTGSLNTPSEPPFQAALREVAEETGFRLPPEQLRDWHRSVEYEIYPHWQHRYPAGITRNTEHWFSAAIPAGSIPTLSEHSAYAWLPAQDAANKVFSPSNRDIILEWLAQFEAA